MNSHAASPPRWSTATISDAADTSPMELSALGAHIDRCLGCRDRWFRLRCAVDAVHEFVAPRFVTTLCIAAAVLGLAALVL
jgi:hypothetical protein